MPTITIQYDDLCELLGRKIPLKDLEYVLPLVKCEVKSVVEKQLTIEVNADRPDMFSVEGVARTLKGFFGIKTGLPTYKVRRGKVVVKVDEKVRDVRPYVVGAVVRNVRLTEEAFQQLIQIQEKLHETLGRKRRMVAIGVHNFDVVKPPITYTALEPEKIRFIPLDGTKPLSAKEILEQTYQGKKYGWILENLPRYPILLDSKGMVLSMPPIINGEYTKVTTSTKNLFIDITGLSLQPVEQTLNILVSNLAERGGIVESVKVFYPRGYKKRVVWFATLKPFKAELNLNYFNSVSGLNVNLKTLVKLAKKARFNVKVKGKEKLLLTIPSYRCDILHQIDLVEDLIMAYGYDKLKPELPPTLTYGRELPKTRFMRKVRELMVGFGFQEIATYVLTSMENQTTKMGFEKLDLIELLNPKTSEFSVVRRWLLPGILSFLSANVHVEYPQKVFECGDVVVPDEDSETKTRNELRVAAAICDYKASYENIQAIVYMLLKNLKIEDWEIKPTEHPSFIPGRVASIKIRGKEAVILGEIHPKILENFRIPNPIAAFELDLTEPLNIYSSQT
ncbi:MAG: phenylalanine--tRNA ligase subunit beta [Candidatus Hecatellales archaeon]|nr:MAG: phenylalanine--tRNA ligase subunit beta [Candidatus Hecatellales archaeon]